MSLLEYHSRGQRAGAAAALLLCLFFVVLALSIQTVDGARRQQRRQQERPTSHYTGTKGGGGDRGSASGGKSNSAKLHKQPILHLNTVADWEELQHNHAYFVVVEDADHCADPHVPNAAQQCTSLRKLVHNLADELPDVNFGFVTYSELKSEEQKKLKYRRERGIGSRSEMEEESGTEDKLSHLSVEEKKELARHKKAEEDLANDSGVWLARQFLTFYCPNAQLPALVLLDDRSARPKVLLEGGGGNSVVSLPQWKAVVEKERHTLELFQEKRWKKNARQNPLPPLPERERQQRRDEL